MKLPICTYCGEPGMHGTIDECIDTLKKAIKNPHARPVTYEVPTQIYRQLAQAS